MGRMSMSESGLLARALRLKLNSHVSHDLELSLIAIALFSYGLFDVRVST